jgi:hypothetical protein
MVRPESSPPLRGGIDDEWRACLLFLIEDDAGPGIEAAVPVRIDVDSAFTSL